MHRRNSLSVSLCLLLASAARLSADEPAAADRPDSAALFDRLDRNGDGKLTGDEVPDDKQNLFRRLVKTSDQDGDGALSRGEFAAGLESKRPQRELTEKLPDDNPAGQLLKNPDKIFNRLDANKDGTITAGEVPDQARPIFDKLLAYADKNSDGSITRQELTDAVAGFKAAAAGTIADMPPAQLFQHLDKNADGKLTSDELPEGRPMLQKLLERGDKNGDGALSQEEFTETVNAFRRFQKNQPGAAPPAGAQSKGPLSENKSDDQSPAMASDAQGAGNPQRMLQRFARMDTNHDGKISRDEFAGPQKKRFDRIDANGDGYLEKDELQRFAAAAGQKMRAAAAGLKQKANARKAPQDAKPAAGDKPAAAAETKPADSDSDAD